MSSREITFAAAGATTPTYIEDVFSTWLYTGNGSTQTITNGIDLAGKGGLVWLKSRSFTQSHGLFDTARGQDPYLSTNNNSAAVNSSNGVIYNSNGFTNKATSFFGGSGDGSGQNYVSWTFRKAPKFFDVVTYTGTGSARTVAHNLGSVPGMIIIKSTTNSRNWAVYHKDIGNTSSIYLNSTSAAFSGDPIYWNNTSPTSTNFTVNDWVQNNEAGQTYVAYLFAHDAGGFGLSGNDNVISCGSFTTDGSANCSVTLGYEPQWILVKRSSSSAFAGPWFMLDNMRGLALTSGQYLEANSSASTGSTGAGSIQINATGFSNGNDLFEASQTYIYMAIRRGPMKTPTSGTSVFVPYTYVTPTGQTSLPYIDTLFLYNRVGTNAGRWSDRLRGNSTLNTRSGATEQTGTQSYVDPGFTPWSPTSFFGTSTIAYVLRRAPGFFDTVCYTGNLVLGRNINHNLGVTPEFIIIKNRNNASDFDWQCRHVGLPAGQTSIQLNLTNAAGNAGLISSLGNATTFSVSDNSQVNGSSSNTYVAYLFASVAGVSKVGSYTGTGATLTINAGLPTGARFVLIKRTDSTGDWWLWDTARGMVAGTDPRIPMNSLSGETNANWVYTVTNGFQIVTTDASVNASGGSYIYLAIA